MKTFSHAKIRFHSNFYFYFRFGDEQQTKWQIEKMWRKRTILRQFDGVHSPKQSALLLSQWQTYPSIHLDRHTKTVARYFNRIFLFQLMKLVVCFSVHLFASMGYCTLKERANERANESKWKNQTTLQRLAKFSQCTF